MSMPLSFLDSDSIARDHARITNTVLGAARDGRLAIVGSAALPQKCAEALRLAGGSIRTFIEYDPRCWGRKVAGIPVLSADEAFELLGSEALVIVGIWSPNHRFGATKEWLKGFGFKHVLPVAAVFWAAFEFTGPHYQLGPPAIYAELRDRARVLREKLADEESRRQLDQHLLWRVTLNSSEIPPADRRHVYFDPRIFKMTEGMVVVDVGAFDGDSLRNFLYWKGRNFGHFYALEPDGLSFDRLRGYVSQLPGDVAGRIETFRLAAAEREGAIHVVPTGKPGSGAADGAHKGEEVACVRLADFLVDRRIDYIKLDIEGAERAALEGAWPLFSTNRVIAAVAVYHCPTDIVDLPLMLIDHLRDYQYYLRSHDDDGIDLVFYAVPSELAVSACARTRDE
jgi:FkbM family methyltransferase